MLMVLCSLVPFIGNFTGETEQYLEDLGEPMASPTSPGHTVFAQFITSDDGVYDYSYASPAHIQAQEALPDEYVYIAYHSESYGNTADAESGNIAPI